MEQTSKFCQVCKKQTLWARPATNHILHLLITLFMCGFWLPIWILASIKIGGWRCQTCGYQGSTSSRLLMPLACVGAVLAAIFILPSLWVSGSRNTSPSVTSAPVIPIATEPAVATEAPSTEPAPATATTTPELPQIAPSQLQKSTASSAADIVKDTFNNNVWKVGDTGTATRMVNAPTSPQHIARFMADIGLANIVAMLNDGSLTKIIRGAAVTLVRINRTAAHPYVECAVEHSGKRYSVFLVLETDKQGELQFTAANDPVMNPPGDPPPASVAKSAPAESPELPPTRIWTSADGKFKTEAEFQGATAGKVTLRKTDGSVITLDIEKLSKADQKWINERAKITPPQERSVKFIFVGDYFSKSNRVRLLPVKVGKSEVKSGTVDTIKAKCLDPKDPFAHRWIVASDFAGDDRKWFEQEAARLWHNQAIEEANP